MFVLFLYMWGQCLILQNDKLPSSYNELLTKFLVIFFFSFFLQYRMNVKANCLNVFICDSILLRPHIVLWSLATEVWCVDGLNK